MMSAYTDDIFFDFWLVRREMTRFWLARDWAWRQSQGAHPEGAHLSRIGSEWTYFPIPPGVWGFSPRGWKNSGRSRPTPDFWSKLPLGWTALMRRPTRYVKRHRIIFWGNKKSVLATACSATPNAIPTAFSPSNYYVMLMISAISCSFFCNCTISNHHTTRKTIRKLNY